MKELRRLLSKLGFASRTDADALIRAGKVKVNGQIMRDPSRAFSETSKIEVENRPIVRVKTRLLLFHKPKGVVTTRRDEKGRRTVFDIIGTEAQGLHAVGRLDMHTTGLLLLTNDTDFSARMTDPKNVIEREYIAQVRGRVETQGRNLKLGDYSVKRLEILKSSQRESSMRIVLCEGKNREIRNLMKSLGHEVTKLKRVRFGKFRLGELAIGAWRAHFVLEAPKK